MVMRKRGTENVSPIDALSPEAHLICPARCKGRWRWGGENRGFVRGQPQTPAGPGPGGARWEQAVPGQSWGEHPGRDGTDEGPSDADPSRKCKCRRVGLRSKDPLPGLVRGQENARLSQGRSGRGGGGKRGAAVKPASETAASRALSCGMCWARVTAAPTRRDTDTVATVG